MSGIETKNKRKTRKLKVVKPLKEVISLTFGDQGENHAGMELIGAIVNKGLGFNLDDLCSIIHKFEDEGYAYELHDLDDLLEDEEIEEKEKKIDDAYVCVIRNGMDYFLKKQNKNSSDLLKEMKSFEWDSKYWDTRRNRVLNKIARANVCFGENDREPNYENKKGRIVGYNNVECLNIIKEGLKEVVGDKANDLICEGNRYYDLSKCGIGWHGDSERRKVIAFRLGESMNLCYSWYYRSNRIGKRLNINLNNGDMYIMSEKAVGTDWKKRSQYMLRHSAGVDGSKYIK